MILGGQHEESSQDDTRLSAANASRRAPGFQRRYRAGPYPLPARARPLYRADSSETGGCICRDRRWCRTAAGSSQAGQSQPGSHARTTRGTRERNLILARVPSSKGSDCRRPAAPPTVGLRIVQICDKTPFRMRALPAACPRISVGHGPRAWRRRAPCQRPRSCRRSRQDRGQRSQARR